MSVPFRVDKQHCSFEHSWPRHGAYRISGHSVLQLIDALSARLLLLKNALAASSPEESELAVKVLMDSRHPRVTDQHLDYSLPI
jgi:hypothetical protein